MTTADCRARHATTHPCAWLTALPVALSLFASGCARELPDDVLHRFEIAFVRDDIDATMALFAEDAQILPEHGEVIKDREGIRTYLKNQMTPVVTFNTMADMSIVRGDMAIEQGHFKVRDVRVGNDIEWGKYIHIWKRERGDWKLYRVMYNTDIAAKVAVSVEPTEEENRNPAAGKKENKSS